jgi:hypothetical protein
MRHCRRLVAFALASVGWAMALDPAPAGAPGPGADVSPLAAPGPVSATAFHPGQVWKFRTRPGEENATLTVLFVERTKLGIFVHLRLDGLHVRDPEAPDRFADAMEFVSITGAVLARSVTSMVRDSAPLPDFKEAHKEWRRLFASGRVGIFNATVAELIAGIEQRVNR